MCQRRFLPARPDHLTLNVPAALHPGRARPFDLCPRRQRRPGLRPAPPNFVFEIIAQSIYSLKPTLLRASFEKNFGGAGRRPAQPPPYSGKWSSGGDLFAMLGPLWVQLESPPLPACELSPRVEG